jgi:hypothetical protein
MYQNKDTDDKEINETTQFTVDSKKYLGVNLTK